MIFRKGRRISNELFFTYGDMEMEIMSKYTYLGIVFTSGGSFNDPQKNFVRSSLKSDLHIK